MLGRALLVGKVVVVGLTRGNPQAVHTSQHCETLECLLWAGAFGPDLVLPGMLDRPSC